MTRTLVIRFSSFGDIVQCLDPATHLPGDIHWVCRSDFQEFLENTSGVQKVWSLNKKDGLFGLFNLAAQLAKQNYDLIYDAHNNLRSHLLVLALRLLAPKFKLRRRSKNRFKRLLLFKFNINMFEKPFVGRKSYAEPIADLLTKNTPGTSQWLKNNPCAPNELCLLAPSAAWELKRWPIEHWQQLIRLMPNQKFGILGGPQDAFCQQLADVDPLRCTNLAGNMSWTETAQLISNCSLLISGDTGVMHLADLYQKPTIALMGPTAFGFPSSASSKVLEIDLACRPCTKDGRGKCSQDVFKKCLQNITPARVVSSALEILS